MKQIKFNETSILKSLLGGTKTTTLRKAFIRSYCSLQGKPCKYKVGEIVELVWTGIIVIDHTMDIIYPSRILAKVKIKSVKRIKVTKKDGIYFLEGALQSELSKSEGFKNPTEMFSFLEKYSNGLETAKPFYLIKWEYLK